MPKKQAPIETLQSFLPAGAYDMVLQYLRQYKVHLTITRKRNSILGDYRHRTGYRNHRISVNGNLNMYSFLITLLHELAHLLTFEQHGRKLQPHGKEWKKIYSELLRFYLAHKIFPADIETEIMKSQKNPAAGSCAEDGLMRVLRKYDAVGEKQLHLLEDIPANVFFRIEGGRVFQKGKKLRKRFKCKEVKTGREYLFSPVYEVEMMSSESVIGS
jgi:SprT protein